MSMTITSSLRFLYIFWGSGLLCGTRLQLNFLEYCALQANILSPCVGILWLRPLQKSFIKHHCIWSYFCRLHNFLTSYFREGIILISTAWLILVLQIFYIRKFKAIFNHQKQTKVNRFRYFDEVYMIIIDFCHNFKSAVKSW